MAALLVPVHPTPASGRETRRQEARAALIDCDSIPNGARETVVDTTRMAVCLPTGFYPRSGFQIIPHGAFAGYVSNWSGICSEEDKSQCWGDGYEFGLEEDDRPGSVEIFAKSAVDGVPDYRIRVQVRSN